MFATKVRKGCQAVVKQRSKLAADELQTDLANIDKHSPAMGRSLYYDLSPMIADDVAQKTENVFKAIMEAPPAPFKDYSLDYRAFSLLYLQNKPVSEEEGVVVRTPSTNVSTDYTPIPFHLVLRPLLVSETRGKNEQNALSL